MTESGPRQAVWRAFDAGWYRSTYAVADEMLAADPSRQAEDVYAAQVRSLGHAPNPYFNESWYLSRYPSVRTAVEAGAYVSGFDHFCRGGHAELSPHWLFDPAWYRERYRRAHGRELDPATDGDPYDHFLRVGQHDGLSGHALFDPAVYTALAPFDVAWRIATDGPFTTFLLHVQAGGTEPTVSNLFDPGWYLARYASVADEILAGRWSCALHHYLANDDPVRFDPSSRFSESAYLASWLDVAAAVGAGGFRNGFDHFIRHGRTEWRFFAPSGTDIYADISRYVVADVSGFPLRTNVFNDITFLPCARDPENPMLHRSGVLDQAGNVIDAFGDPWLTLQPCTVSAARESGPFIYGGVLMSHFGHVLTDGLARLWFMRWRPDLPILWHWIDHSVAHDMWPGWLDQIWRILGLDQRRHHRITTPITVDQVILPQPGLLAPNVLHKRQAEALAVLQCTTPWLGNRVWLSRRGVPKRFGCFDREDEVEAVLTARGWTIFRPEDHPVSDQVNIFATAAVVAGSIGSAFHSVLLSASPRAKLILVCRPGLPHEYYDAVARARDLHQHYILPELRPYSASGPGATFELVDPRRLADQVCQVADLATRT